MVSNSIAVSFTWEEFIKDVEEQINIAELRVKALKASLQIFRKNEEFIRPHLLEKQ